MTLDRREFIGVSAGAVIAPLVFGLPAARARGDGAGAAAARKATNLVFMVADGMSFGTLILGDLLRQLRDNRRSAWIDLIGTAGVTRSLVQTRSADGFVTDSSAASTAWGIGELVDNGRVGMTPDGRFPTPILVHAAQAGKATGLVTTTRVTHATPAGFCCNIPTNRDDEKRIARQMLERRVPLLFGGGRKFFPESTLALRAADLQVTASRAEFDAFAPGEQGAGPMLSLFADSHMSFEIDRVTDKLAEPSLAEMSAAALRRLDRAGGGNGFVVQIEGGRVDHGGHYNDAAGLLYDMLAFDDAVAAVRSWAATRDDTLVIVTADHATANPGLTEYGARGVRNFLKALEFKHSFEWMERRLAPHFSLANPEPPEFGDGEAAQVTGASIDAELLRSTVLEATGIALGKGEMDLLVRWKRGEMTDGFAMASSRFGPLAAVLANHHSIAFLSPNHTADPVELTAWGPGSAGIPASMVINEVHAHLVRALDLPPAKPV